MWNIFGRKCFMSTFIVVCHIYIDKAGLAKVLKRYDLYCSEIKVEKEH